jgi:hypothetical protein
MYLGRVNENQLRNARRAFKEHKERCPQTRLTLFYFLKMFVGDIEELKEELEEKAGAEALRGIRRQKPEELPAKEYLDLVNLLMERINEHDRKALNDTIKAWKEEERKSKTQDPRDNRLFPVVCSEYEYRKDQADQLKWFYIRREVADSYAKRYYKEHRKEIEQEWAQEYAEYMLKSKHKKGVQPKGIKTYYINEAYEKEREKKLEQEYVQGCVQKYAQEYSKALSKSKHKKGIKAYAINEVSGKILDNEIPKLKLRLPKDGNLYIGKDKKLHVKEGRSDKILSAQLETLRSITIPCLREALRSVNRRMKIFPEKEFARDEEKIYRRLIKYQFNNRKK